MNKSMIATQSMTYGTRRLLPGEEFVASRRDADLLSRIGRAKLVDADSNPIDHEVKKDGVGTAKVEDARLADLRKQYQQKFGKRPFNGWDAKNLSEKLAEAKG
ncbi:hypothetical protein [Sinorhizobium medicae]|uniref:hypothetical protein n=1 Tax=Sinorhizobium medicae TaxID=110321 RepID=UPI000FDA8F85|nr:hypothetical protein [Sinorhizobium medicae]RVJ03361.1 hypothetical protein CN181_24920 [Sinorhizobium medicae]